MKRLPSPAQWFANLRIRTKIVLLYIPLLLVPLLVLGLYSNTIFSGTMIDRTKKGVSDNSQLIITRLSGMLTNTESCANMLTLNLNKVLQLMPEQEGFESGEGLQLYTKLTNELSFARLVFPDVESAAFISADGRIYGSAPALENDRAAALSSSLVKTTAATNGASLWFPMQRRSFLVTDPNQAVLTLGKTIYNINTGQRLGVLILNVQESALSGIYRTIGGNPNGLYFIADESGTVISSPHDGELLQPIHDEALRRWVAEQRDAAEIREISARQMLVSTRSFPQLGWKLVSVIPMSSLTGDIHKVTALILGIGFLCLIFAILAAGLLSQIIAKPIIRVAKSMMRFHEGHLDIVLQVRGADEIALFSSGFNTLTRRMKELLEDMKLEQRKKREYELALIQAQIKPHFLYNSLDVIYALSQMDRPRDVQRMTKALADYYRVALSKGMEMITIEEEIQNMRDYLSIQRIRYSDVFDYHIEIDPQIMGGFIPKLTLQPLVENAIYHGLKEKPSFGRLLISGKLMAQHVEMVIEDDGVGMPAERLKQVMGEGPSPAETGDEIPPIAANSTVPYGIPNVNNRIRLYFGEEYGLTIQSEPGVGTKVTVRLPAPERMANEEA